MSEERPTPEDPFRALRLEYLENARAKAMELTSLAAIAPQAEAVTALRQLAHNLRGSGGFYGFQQITKAAATLEELAVLALEGAAVAEGALPQATQALVDAIHTARLP